MRIYLTYQLLINPMVLLYEFLMYLSFPFSTYSPLNVIKFLTHDLEMHRWSTKSCEPKMPILGEDILRLVPELRGAGLKRIEGQRWCGKRHLDLLTSIAQSRGHW